MSLPARSEIPSWGRFALIKSVLFASREPAGERQKYGVLQQIH